MQAAPSLISRISQVWRVDASFVVRPDGWLQSAIRRAKPIASPGWRKEDLSHWMTSRPTAVFNWFAAFK
jgi:hypothetical protein